MRYALFTIALISLFSITLNAQGQFDQTPTTGTGPTVANSEATLSTKSIEDFGLASVIGTVVVQIKTIGKDTIVLRPDIQGVTSVDPKGVAKFSAFTDVVILPGTPGVILKDGVQKTLDGVSSFRVSFWTGKDFLYLTFAPGSDGNFVLSCDDSKKLVLGKYTYTVIRGFKTNLALPMNKETAPPAIAPGRTN